MKRRKRQAVEEKEPRAQMWAARRRVYGVPEEMARSELMGSVPGRLRLAGYVNDVQLEAARRLEALWLRYVQTLAGPEWDASPPLERRERGHDERDTTAADIAATEAWHEAMDALKGRRLVKEAVWRAVVEDRDLDTYGIVNMRLGLNALVKLWRLQED